MQRCKSFFFFFFAVGELRSLHLQLHLIGPHAAGIVEEKNHFQREKQSESAVPRPAKNALADIQILICCKK